MEETATQNQQEEMRLRVPCEVYSRIVGYLRPVQNWHVGKQQEFDERKPFRVPETVTGEREPESA